MVEYGFEPRQSTLRLNPSPHHKGKGRILGPFWVTALLVHQCGRALWVLWDRDLARVVPGGAVESGT